MKYQKCSNDHEHRRMEVKDSGFYPLEMGRVLLSAARGVLKKSLPRGEPQTVSSMRGCENLRDWLKLFWFKWRAPSCCRRGTQVRGRI